jgi:hypothetical protein
LSISRSFAASFTVKKKAAARKKKAQAADTALKPEAKA